MTNLDPSFAAGALLGVLAALMINLGKGVQKQMLMVLLDGQGAFSKAHRRDLALWCVGLSLTAGGAVPYMVGMKLSRSPSVMASVSGIGLVALTIYAVRVIGERLGARDLLGIAVVIVSTTALGVLRAVDPPAAHDAASGSAPVAVVAVVLPMATLCLASRRWRALHGVAWGLASGACIGLSLFCFDAALSVGGGGVSSMARTPWTWLALLFGVGATVVTQVGFARARALVVVPCVSSATILVPWVLEAAAYGSVPPPSVLALVAAIVAGVVCLATGAAARVAATA